VEKAKVNRTLFIAKMDRNISGVQLREFAEAYGAVESTTIIKNHQTNKSKGCGFVKFMYREDAMAAFVGLKNDQKKWVIEWATSSNDPESLGIDKTSVFVGGLNPTLVTKELLEERFGAYGKIQSVTVVNKDSATDGTVEDQYQDQNSRSAYAFLRYVDPASSSAAIEQENGQEWLYRRIRVQYCESQEMKSKRRANKFVANYSQYYRPNQIGPPMYMMGGLSVYNMQPTYLRKGADQPAYSPFLSYPMMNPGMLGYPNQPPWLYTQPIQLQGQTEQPDLMQDEFNQDLIIEQSLAHQSQIMSPVQQNGPVSNDAAESNEDPSIMLSALNLGPSAPSRW